MSHLKSSNVSHNSSDRSLKLFLVQPRNDRPIPTSAPISPTITTSVHISSHPTRPIILAERTRTWNHLGSPESCAGCISNNRPVSIACGHWYSFIFTTFCRGKWRAKYKWRTRFVDGVVAAISRNARLCRITFTQSSARSCNFHFSFISVIPLSFLPSSLSFYFFFLNFFFFRFDPFEQERSVEMWNGYDQKLGAKWRCIVNFANFFVEHVVNVIACLSIFEARKW